MMKKRVTLKNLIARRSARPVRHLFTVSIDKVTFPDEVPAGITDSSEISVCFERGGKMASSFDRSPSTFGKDGACEVNFQNQELSLIVTMYEATKRKSKQNTFQNKKGIVVVRQKTPCSTDSARPVHYQGLGMVELELSDITNRIKPDGDVEEVILMKSAAAGAFISFCVTAVALDSPLMGDNGKSGGNLIEETMSVQSGFSNAAIGAADFPFQSNSHEMKNFYEQSIDDKTAGDNNIDVDEALSMGSQHTPPSALMISRESNLVLSQQLEENQRQLSEQKFQISEQVKMIERYRQHNDRLQVDLRRLADVVGKCDVDKDVEIAKLTKEKSILHHEFVAQTHNFHEINIEFHSIKERDAEREHSISILEASNRFLESQLAEKMDEISALKRYKQLYAEKIANLELLASGQPQQLQSPFSKNGDIDGYDVYSGMLTKRGSFYPSWKKRYFELEGRTLNYYVTRDGMQWKGNFRFTAQTEICPDARIDDRNCFFVENHNRRLYLQAETIYDKESWINVIQKCINSLK